MNAPLEFDLTLKEVPVILKTNGTPTEYVLRELDGKGRDLYMDDVAPRMKYEKGQPAGIKSMAGMKSKLISLSLHVKATGAKVSEDVVQNWPSSVQEALFKKAQELSGLGDESKAAQEAAKNA